MGPVEALKLALEKEIEAAELYRNLSLESDVSKDTFLFLMGQEQKHKKLIEDKIAEITK